MHGELSAAKAIQKILQESELNDTIVLREATEKSTKQTEKERISDSETDSRPQAKRAARKEIKERDNQVNDPIVVGTLKQSPHANENIPNTSAETSLQIPSRLDVNTPLVHRNIIQSARSSKSEHHFNSQIWRIQEENAESYSTIRELAAGLPTFYGNKWRESAKKLGAKCGEYSFTNFIEFTQEASLDANHPVFSHDALTSTRKELENKRNSPVDKMRRNPERKERKKRRGISLNTTGSESSCKNAPDSSLCVPYKGKHDLSTCKNFLERPLKERLEFCMSRGICFSCLNQAHTARQCNRKTQCEVCKKPHATALHRFPAEERREESTQETIRATNNCVNCSDITTSLILPVLIHHKNDPDRRVKVYAVLDDQNDTCFVTDDVRDKLGVTGLVIKLELGTMHAIEKIDTQRIDDLVVSR